MPRTRSHEPTLEWKLHIPALLAGKLEHMFFDRVLGKPRYAARKELTISLYEWWLARELGSPEPHVPSLGELMLRRRR